MDRKVFVELAKQAVELAINPGGCRYSDAYLPKPGCVVGQFLAKCEGFKLENLPLMDQYNKSIDWWFDTKGKADGEDVVVLPEFTPAQRRCLIQMQMWWDENPFNVMRLAGYPMVETSVNDLRRTLMGEALAKYEKGAED